MWPILGCQKGFPSGLENVAKNLGLNCQVLIILVPIFLWATDFAGRAILGNEQV